MAVLIVVGVLSNIVQFGLVFSSKSLAVKWDRLNPVAGFGRIFLKGFV